MQSSETKSEFEAWQFPLCRVEVYHLVLVRSSQWCLRPMCQSCCVLFRIYPDTQQLRMRIENQSIVMKAFQNAPHFEPQSLSLSIDLQARDAFFASYVTSKCWDFLDPYYRPTHLWPADPVHCPIASYILD